MLNFFKRTDLSPTRRNNNNNNNNNNHRPKLNRSISDTPTQSISGDSTPLTSPTTTIHSFDDDHIFDHPKERSHLSNTLPDVLSNKSALAYFAQYLDTRNALHYLQCWLDVEKFRRAVNETASVSSATTNCIDDSKVDIRVDLTDDALRIFKKYVALEAPDNVGCGETLRNTLVENICNDKKGDYFGDVQGFVYAILERDYFGGFLTSDYFCKHQIDVLTSGNIVLDDVLYNETALFYFMEFLEQERGRNLLEFWLAATNLQQQLEQQKEFYDPIEAQNDAVILYDKYFSLQAHYPLGFGDKIRFAVEQNICGEHGLIINCFEQPLKLVEQKLQHNYLRQFVNSQLFYKYLSELINTVQSCGYSTQPSDGNSSSSNNSEGSFCTNGAFLAMAVPRNKNNINQHANKSDMNIETRHLYDPDSLWKRKKYRRLTLGHVTELGKFIRDSEPDPDKGGAFTLRDVVRRFVTFDEDKRKEEMAWQVAEMIVKDITSVTLSEQKI